MRYLKTAVVILLTAAVLWPSPAAAVQLEPVQIRIIQAGRGMFFLFRGPIAAVEWQTFDISGRMLSVHRLEIPPIENLIKRLRVPVSPPPMPPGGALQTSNVGPAIGVYWIRVFYRTYGGRTGFIMRAFAVLP